MDGSSVIGIETNLTLKYTSIREVRHEMILPLQKYYVDSLIPGFKNVVFFQAISINYSEPLCMLSKKTIIQSLYSESLFRVWQCYFYIDVQFQYRSIKVEDIRVPR